MQINGPAHVHAPQQISAPHRLTTPKPAQPTPSVVGADQLDISQEADFVSRVREVPDIRADRVAEIREQIEAGTYETDEKLDIALDRLLDEIG